MAIVVEPAHCLSSTASPYLALLSSSIATFSPACTTSACCSQSARPRAATRHRPLPPGDLEAAATQSYRGDSFTSCCNRVHSSGIERAQLTNSSGSLSSSQWRHGCSCLGQDDSFLGIRDTKATRDIKENVFNSFKQMLSMDDNSFFYGTDDDAVVDKLKNTSLLKAVVKVFCISAEPDYSLPWQLQRQYATTGSGFMISGRRLLTNAHCVDHHTQVTVTKTGDDTKYIATVLAIGHECDIALLTVQDDEFWKDAKPLEFGGLPNLQDAVTVVGYPFGGDTVSVTKGVVSRIEVISYAHGDAALLAVQIDAAINEGNSGGPAFNDDGDCVGIAFQAYSCADNIGYVIPTSVIHHFLKDYNMHGKYTGFPSLGFIFQKLGNPDLRASLKMTPKQKGILVRKVEPTSPSKNILQEGDVVLSFDGVPISNQATVPLRPGERIALSFLVSQKFTGDKAVLGILRDGQEIELTTTLKPSYQMVPIHIKSRQPSYFIIAGLVFTAVSEPLLQEDYTDDDKIHIGVKIRTSARFNMAEFEGQEMILLSQVLAHAVNIGYEGVSHLRVSSFNGTKIQNMRHLTELVDSCNSQYMHFELDDNITVVLSTDSARASTPEILRDYCISQDRSQNLRDPMENLALNGALI